MARTRSTPDSILAWSVFVAYALSRNSSTYEGTSALPLTLFTRSLRTVTPGNISVILASNAVREFPSVLCSGLSIQPFWLIPCSFIVLPLTVAFLCAHPIQSKNPASSATTPCLKKYRAFWSSMTSTFDPSVFSRRRSSIFVPLNRSASLVSMSVAVTWRSLFS